MLFRVEKIQAMQRPLPRNQSSVCSIVHLENKMIGVEADWISRSDDLATVTRSAEHGWFNGWVEDLLYKISKKMLLVGTPPQPGADGFLRGYSPKIVPM